MTNKANILIVDDSETNRNILDDMILALGHIPILAENGAMALSIIEKQPPDLVLLDVLMSNMDGYEVLERLKSNSDYLHIPVIMISALDDIDSILRCIEKGAEDYLPKPFNPSLLKARIGNSLAKKSLHDREERLRIAVEDYNITLEDELQKRIKEIASTQLSLIFAMAKLAESRDPETGEHLERIAEFSKVLSEKLRLLPKYADEIDDTFIANTHSASPLHDIGKVGIPDSVLKKPGKLTESEWNIMKTHSHLGAKTLSEVQKKHPGNRFILLGIDIAQSHHEKWNGSGYPHGLSGENIPLSARILALGDVYDALTSKRCYKEALPHEKSKEIILNGKGKHFDPVVVDAFIAAEDEFLSIRKRYIDTVK